MPSRRVWLILMASVVLCGVMSGGYWLLNRTLADRFKSVLLAKGLPDVTIDGFTTYYDGVVIRSLRVGDAFQFGKIYLQGKPWQLWRHPSAYIRIYDAVVMPHKWLDGNVVWPFATSATVMVNQFRFSLPLLGRNLIFSGAAVQNPQGPLLADFTVADKQATLTGKAELGFAQAAINSIALSFDDAEFDSANLKMRRGGGWVTLDYASGWTVSGELAAGYLSVADEPLLETTIKISGHAVAPEWTMTAREQADPAVWNFDLKNDGLTIHRGSQSAFMHWQGLDDALLGDVALLMRSLKEPVAEEPPMPQ